MSTNNATASHEAQSKIDPREMRSAFGKFATGVTVVTTRAAEGHLVGLTVNSFSSLSLDPPLILWSLVKHSPNLQVFCDAPHFAINILSADQQGIARQFATPVKDKFVGVDSDLSTHGIPLLADALAHFECSLAHVYEGGDHLIFVGKVEKFSTFERCPLLFHGGDFQQIAIGDRAPR
ncbi:flavin reductase family protein [Polaromonas hydrogenivorans]|uniref:Flavin reductase family protein n=1 Tax=Polaromonas hydrogenivorans TaxID=335476 RepID=A0AAU7LZ04_9BURK